jgi:hypothetical protein
VVTDRANSARTRGLRAQALGRSDRALEPQADATGRRRGPKHRRGTLAQRSACSRRAGLSPPGVDQLSRTTLQGSRLIALRLTPEQRERAQRRKKRLASKGQRQLQQDTLYLAGWLLNVPTLPSQQWSDQQVLSLYRARWHIELLFKRLKPLLDMHRLRCTTVASALSTVLFLLVGWALVEQERKARPFGDARCDGLHPTGRRGGRLDPKGNPGLVASWAVGAALRVEACRSECGSLESADPRPLHSGTLSGLLAALATLFV